MNENILDKVDFEIVSNGSILYEYENITDEQPLCISVKEGEDDEMVSQIGKYIMDIMDSKCVYKVKITIEALE